MAQADGFFSRWSRRKAAVEKGLSLDEPAKPMAQADAGAVPAQSAQQQVRQPVQAQGLPVSDEASPVQSGTESPHEAPPPTMADAKLLTPQSDFKPFMAPNVSADVKNAAMKKLFADPHFNVMDRMDIYIDDYSKPDPLPEAMLRQLASAKFLKLFDEEPVAAAPDPTGANPDTQALADVSQSPTAVPDSPDSELAHDAHADLRLQPHHAPASPPVGAGPGRNADPA